MRSQPLPSEASRRRAEEQFKTTKKIDYQPDTSTAERRAEAEKTTRLRALRLAKEAADKDTAKLRKSEPRRRVPEPLGSDTPSVTTDKPN